MHFHLHRCTDRLITGDGIRSYVDNWQSYLDEALSDSNVDDLRCHSRNGHPADRQSLIKELEALSGRRLVRRKPGRKGY